MTPEYEEAMACVAKASQAIETKLQGLNFERDILLKEMRILNSVWDRMRREEEDEV